MKRFTKWAILATVALLIVVSTAGCTSNTGDQTPSAGGSITPSATSMITYDSGNFTIQYPSNWANMTSKGSLSDIITIMSPGNGLATSALFTNPPSDTTLSSWTNAAVSTAKNNQNYTQISAGNATLAGSPAYKNVYTQTYANVITKHTEIWTVIGGNVYTINYIEYPQYHGEYADTLQKMIDSFQIKQ